MFLVIIPLFTSMEFMYIVSWCQKNPLQIHIFNLSLMRAMFVPQIKPFPYAEGLIVEFA